MDSVGAGRSFNRAMLRPSKTDSVCRFAVMMAREFWRSTTKLFSLYSIHCSMFLCELQDMRSLPSQERVVGWGMKNKQAGVVVRIQERNC